MAGPVYLDHAATTPMRPEAVHAMLPYLSEQYANPSGSHRFARAARKAVDDAREVVASVLGCDAGEVVFTSGGTESDNAAVLGSVARRGGTAMCSAAEHHAVLAAVERVHGVVLPTDDRGVLDAGALDDALTARSDVSLVSVMTVNNEVGSISPIADLASIVRSRSSAWLHTDAVQAPSWIDLRTITPHVDLLSLSAHKFGGPKGIGVLVVRNGVQPEPTSIGGGQERERRSGTQNVPGIVAMAEALRLADEEREAERVRITALRDRLVDALTSSLDGVRETVGREAKVAGSAHLCIEGIENEALLFLLDEADVCASAASACASGAMEPSHVLAAMGVPVHLARGAVRLTLGRTTSVDDVDRAVQVVTAAVQRLRRQP